MKTIFKSFLFALVLACNVAFGQNLTVSADHILYGGTYGVVELKNNAQLTIDGSVTIGNFNPINSSAVKVKVNKGATLTISSSLNMNGNYTFINEGTVFSKSFELQNGINCFKNTGKHYITGDLQISSKVSTYIQGGYVHISNFLNLHGGCYQKTDCGITETYGLNVNSGNVVTGKGFIRVTDILNLNQDLTLSKDITFWFGPDKDHPKTINNISKLGKAAVDAESPCLPKVLPVKYDNLSVRNVVENGVNYVYVSFKVIENSGLNTMNVKYSADGKNDWRVMVIVMPEQLVAGKTYAGKFERIKK